MLGLCGLFSLVLAEESEGGFDGCGAKPLASPDGPKGNSTPRRRDSLLTKSMKALRFSCTVGAAASAYKISRKRSSEPLNQGSSPGAISTTGAGLFFSASICDSSSLTL